MTRWLSYIPRLIRHYKHRRQLGQSAGHAFRSARQRTRLDPWPTPRSASRSRDLAVRAALGTGELKQRDVSDPAQSESSGRAQRSRRAGRWRGATSPT